jgi:hypothetical protein
MRPDKEKALMESILLTVQDIKREEKEKIKTINLRPINKNDH